MTYRSGSPPPTPRPEGGGGGGCIGMWCAAGTLKLLPCNRSCSAEFCTPYSRRGTKHFCPIKDDIHFSRPKNCLKTIPCTAVHTHKVYIWEYLRTPPPPPPPQGSGTGGYDFYWYEIFGQTGKMNTAGTDWVNSYHKGILSTPPFLECLS